MLSKFKDFNSYDNWVLPSYMTMVADFVEYQKKEDTKWKIRSKTFGFRFPIFKSLSEYESCIEKATLINLSEYRTKIGNLSSEPDIESLRELVSGYIYPRDIDRIIVGLKKNKEIPLPVILKGSKGMFIMSGNTRQNVAYILGIRQMALLIDVSI